MDLGATPRTDDAPPAPASHILPTPGHWPLAESARERPAEVAADASADDSPTPVPASRTLAVTIGNAVLRRPARLLRSTVISTPELVCSTPDLVAIGHSITVLTVMRGSRGWASPRSDS